MPQQKPEISHSSVVRLFGVTSHQYPDVYGVLIVFGNSSLLLPAVTLLHLWAAG